MAKKNEGADSRSPQEKRGTAGAHHTKGSVRWANDSGPAKRNVQPDPMRHLKASDGREDGGPA